jgi:hypothetical protein
VKYLLSIYTDESAFRSATPEDIGRTIDAYEAFSVEVAEKGAYLAGEGLQPTATATTVRVRGGETLVTDGPFAETKEQLGGYYLSEAKDADEAFGIAARIPGASHGSVEVRPVMVFDQE